jgi:hypothetical protein
MKRPVKYVVWLKSLTGTSAYDAWFCTFARSPKEAKAKCEKVIDTKKFLIGSVKLVKKFREQNGNCFHLGRKCNRKPG